MAAAVVRRLRRRRRRRLRSDAIVSGRGVVVVIVGHDETGAASSGRGQPGRRPTIAPAATAVHVARWPAAERRRGAALLGGHVRSQGPFQVTVRRTAGSGHAPAPGRHPGQGPEQKAGLVSAVSISILVKHSVFGFF